MGDSMVSGIDDQKNRKLEDSLRQIFEVGKILASVLTADELDQLRSQMTQQSLEKLSIPSQSDQGR